MDKDTPQTSSRIVAEAQQQNPWKRPFTFDRVVRILITFGVALGFLWLLKRLSSVLLPFLVAWLIAYLLEPMVQRNRQVLKLKGRFLAIALTLLETLLVIAVLGIIFVPSIVTEMHQVGSLIKQYATSSGDIALIPETVHDFIRAHIDFEGLSRSLTHQDLKSILDFLFGMISGGVDLIFGFFSWFLVLLYVVFIMLDYDRLLRGFKKVIPLRYRPTVLGVVNDVKHSMNHYFRGQSMIALLVGILFSIGFLIVGLPLAVVLGLFIGLLNLVPYLQLISIVPTTMLCLVYSMQGGVAFWPIWWECMAVYVVVQCIQDLFLTPKIMGKEMGLNPAIILLSLSVWGSLLGFIGLIIALPLTTLLLAYYNQYIISRNDGETPHQHEADLRAVEEIETPPES